ncbi:3-keto-5-aminohexanoate cleavage protein [Catenuloplanes niger]
MRSPLERIKACLNGGRRPGEHPAVPITPADLAGQAADAVAAGAEALHLHPRDRAGDESLDAGDVGAAVAAVRRAWPRGAGRGDDRAVDRWRRRGPAAGRGRALGRPAARGPARLRLGQRRRARLRRAERDAAPGRDRRGGRRVVDRRRRDAAASGRATWFRVLVEIIDGTAGDADAILTRLDDLGVPGPRLLHGENATCWPLIAEAGRRGLPTRIGLEDTVTGPAGEPVAGNAALVRHALTVWTASARGDVGARTG